jgi:hypothetical protein
MMLFGRSVHARESWRHDSPLVAVSVSEEV